MLNNIHFVVLHVLTCSILSFAIFSRDLKIKFDASLMLLIDSLVLICRTSTAAWIKHLKMVNS